MSLLSHLDTLTQHVWPHVVDTASAYRRAVAEILTKADDLRPMSSDALRKQMEELKTRVKAGDEVTARPLLVGGFALVHEAARRALGIELYEVQHLAGMALVRGTVAEMQTGEGKTLAAALAASNFAAGGQGVHVVTTNQYLAERDFAELAPLYQMLGLTAGVLLEGDRPENRHAYACDITYGTGYQVGFDYLRDQLSTFRQPKPKLGDRVRRRLAGEQPAALVYRQRGHAVAIIDEIDSVLLDEGCMPLVLSEQSSAGQCEAGSYAAALATAQRLTAGDFVLQGGTIRLTEQGVTAIHADVEAVQRMRLLRPWTLYVEQALRALHLLRRDVDYVVSGGRIQIVDAATGRIFADRTWRDGLQQIIEAREGVPVTPEHSTAVRISRQRYFRLYQKTCGMTGTAEGTAREFWNLYRMPVARIPLRVRSRRLALADRFFVSVGAKLQAIVADVVTLHSSGRPILIGTRTIAESQLIAGSLSAVGLPHQLLNGRQDADEAQIIARAGRQGTITVATNMAGRGTDIKLGSGVADLGGLHLIAAQRNLSQRVDRQLIGRVARQGDLGSYQFFVSADDDLVRRDEGRLRSRMQNASAADGELQVSFSAEIARLQSQLEADAARERSAMLARDRWLEELAGKLSGAS